jgi:hypothetical protein
VADKAAAERATVKRAAEDKKAAAAVAADKAPAAQHVAKKAAAERAPRLVAELPVERARPAAATSVQYSTATQASRSRDPPLLR